MKLNASTKIHDLLETYPFLLDFLAGYRPKFGVLRNRAMRATMGRMATLSMVASMGDVALDTLIGDIAAEIRKNTGKEVEIDTSSGVGNEREKLDELKEIIRDLHRGVEFSTVKKRFDRLMSRIDPSQIAVMEEELIREGMPVEEIQRLCDLHVTVFKDALGGGEPVDAHPGHPVHTFMAENTAIAKILNELDPLITNIAGNPEREGLGPDRQKIGEILAHLAAIDTHFTKKENQLFPFLEKHGVTGPSQVMWGIHDEIRSMIKDLRTAVENDDRAAVVELGPKCSCAIVEMIYKENTILYPMAMTTLGEDEWREIRRGEGEIGYAFVTPAADWPAEIHDGDSGTQSTVSSVPELQLDTGSLTLEQINLLFTHLPVEVSFVDEHDRVRYYSDTAERIFPRSPGVIGRKVQNCHPPKSLHIVNRIVEEFRAGTRNSADFWIRSGEKFVLIRYIAVRDSQGAYRGTIEVTQDITSIRNLEGEQRLLDWDSKT